MYQPTVSVIINTTNRAYHLKRLLDCLTHQTYDNFEVVVVNGPSTDNTEEILSQYQDAIRIVHCLENNLCMSRNIGVCASSGDILAFIDDDAVPYDTDWLANGVRYFENVDVGIVGGESVRINGNYEFKYGKCSIYGDNVVVCGSPVFSDQNVGWFRRAQGNNMFLRRSVVKKIGGFDGYYEYYLDETDVAIRIQQSGYEMEYANGCCVVHEAAKGAFRKGEFDLKWDVIARSQGYFVTKFTKVMGKNNKECEKYAYESGKHWLTEFGILCREKRITKEEKKHYSEMVKRGLRQGIQDGFTRERVLNFNIPECPENFKRFDKNVSKQNLNICFFCEDDIVNPIGGIQTYTHALAYGLSSRGHNVYVVTHGESELLSNQKGVNICSVVPKSLKMSCLSGLPTSQRRLDFSYACFVKLQQLKKLFHIDVVETPIWDSYGVVTSYLEKDIPLVTRLQTPLKMVMETFKKNNSADLELLMQYEAALLEKSEAIITISDCVKNTVEKLYEIKFTQPVYKNYLGIVPDTKALNSRSDDGKLVVFFIGRLERRKGIDSIIASLPALMEKFSNLEFRLAGDNSIYDEVIGDTYQHKLLSDNRGARWLERVHFLGKISEQQKEQELANCDVFVSPSLYESFGIIFIEAMRYAKPVIGCNVGGMQEVIANGNTGLLCEPGNADSFRNCLEKLLENADMRHKFGNAGRERLNSMFSEETMCKCCEEIYQKVKKMVFTTAE